MGRIEDLVVGPDGRKLVRFHGIFVSQPHVREGQIVQETRSRLRVKVVPTSGFDEADTLDIVSRIRQRLGTAVEVIVETVDHIPRTKSGKFQAVVSLLEKQDARRAGARRAGAAL
jgi:phenylacetate-CoA ligase